MKKCPNCKRNPSKIILTENKIKHLLSEDLKFHIDNGISLTHVDSISIKVIKEARKLYSRGVLQLNENDTTLVTSNIGDKVEGKALDLPIKDGENPTDTITMDVPLFIRMLEYAKEDAETDMDLHDVTEKAVALSKDGDILDMSHYENIVGKDLKESYNMYHRNPSTKQINKFKFNIYESNSKLDKIRRLIKESLGKSPIKSIELVYTEKGNHFYNAYVKYENGSENTMKSYDLEDELNVTIPLRYSEKYLKILADELNEKGISMTYNNSKDI